MVVGAGISGLCAAQQLRRFGHRVVVLEAQSRIGGRVLSEEVGGARIDMGAMLLVGTAGNPLVTLCEQTGCRVHTLDRSMCPLYDGDAVLPAEVDASAEARFNKMMDNVSEQRAVRKGKRAMLGTSNGGRWEADLLHVESGGGNGGGGNGGGGHGGGGNGGGRGAAARPNGGTPARGGGAETLAGGAGSKKRKKSQGGEPEAKSPSVLAPKAEASLAPDTAAATPKGEVDSNGKPRLATQEKGGAGSGSALASFATTSPDAQPLRPGVRVKAKYLASDPAIRPSGAERSRGYGPGRWYEGTVHAVNADGTYAVAYDDGDFEASVQCEYIQVVITDASAAVDALGAVAVEADRRQSAGSGEGELGTVEGGGIEGGGIEGGGIEGGGIKSRGVGEVKAEIDGGDGSGEGDITADGESNGDGNACGLDGDSTHANGDGAADGNADRDEDGDVDGEGEGSASYEAMYGVSGRPRNTWLACDVCGQWRRLGKMKDKDLPETWTCDLNPDPAFAKCEVPQELPDDDIDRLLGLLPPKPKAPKAPKPPKPPKPPKVPSEKPAPSPKLAAKRAAAACAPMPGEPPPVCGKSLGEVLDRLVEKTKLPAEEARAIHWHLANLEYGCATALGNVSLSWWDQDDGNDYSGDHGEPLVCTLCASCSAFRAPRANTTSTPPHPLHRSSCCPSRDAQPEETLLPPALPPHPALTRLPSVLRAVVVSNGYDRMVDGLAKYLDVLCEREVSQIEYSASGVRVHTKGGGEGIEADAVLITVPLGVLKARSVTFEPPLPPWKRQAIERLGFGPIEKIVLLFEQRFWDADADFFGCLPPPDLTIEELTYRRGEFFLFWNLERSHGIPALICISSGAFAEKSWSHHSYKGVVNKALAVLKRTFGPQVNSLFKRSQVSDWGRNPYARGSYSYIAVGGSGRDYDELAWPVGVHSQRVFFAGEHTNGQHPATATGAFITGLREAQRIDECARNNFAPVAQRTAEQ